jgi:hypothetical protein
MMINNIQAELEMIWEEVVVVCFRVLYSGRKITANFVDRYK